MATLKEPYFMSNKDWYYFDEEEELLNKKIDEVHILEMEKAKQEELISSLETQRDECESSIAEQEIIFSSILDKSLEAAFRYLDFKRRGVEARCEYVQRPDRKYELNCILYEKKEKIFETTIIVDSEYRARQMKQNYLERPDVIYRGTTALLSGKMQFLFD